MAKSSPILFDIVEKAPEDAAFLEALGHQVVVCNGPHPTKVCPLLTKEGCALATEAHGIVFEFDLDRPEHRAILRRYRKVIREDVPIRVVIRPDQVGRYPELLKGLKVLTHRPAAGDLDGLAAEVEAADYFFG